MVWALPLSLATTHRIDFLSFPVGTKMFQFPTFPYIYYFTHICITGQFLPVEFPHSDIYGSMNICFFPQLFAAYHVLLRLLVPRYSPYALCSLTLRFLNILLFSFGLIVLHTFVCQFYLSIFSHLSIYFSMCCSRIRFQRFEVKK